MSDCVCFQWCDYICSCLAQARWRTHDLQGNPEKTLKINMWNILVKVWKMIFLCKWVIFRFHLNLPGCFFRGWWHIQSICFPIIPTFCTGLSKSIGPSKRSTRTTSQILACACFFAGSLRESLTRDGLPWSVRLVGSIYQSITAYICGIAVGPCVSTGLDVITKSDAQIKRTYNEKMGCIPGHA